MPWAPRALSAPRARSRAAQTLERTAALGATAGWSSSGEVVGPVAPEHERAVSLEAIAALTVAGIGETPLPPGYIDFPGIGLITRPVGGPLVRAGQGAIPQATRGALT